MIATNHGISPTHPPGVGVIGGMDDGPGDDDIIDEDGLFDAVFEDVVEDVAEEPEAHVGCEEAPIRLPSNPSDPTPAEREKHNKTHLPHRPWCSICVQARAREDKHYTAVCAERESGIAEVAMDYIQVEDTVPAHAEREATEADKTVEQTEAAEKEARAPAASKACTETHKKRLLVGRDRWTKAVFSFLVQVKGI